MLLLNHFRRPCHLFSYTIAIILLADYALAEYDCSAKDDGWYYDPDFCHIYWRCIHGTAEEFECASGTAWDHHANRCNWLDSIDCTRSEETTPKAMSGDSGEQNVTEGNSGIVEGTDSLEDPPPTVVKTKKKKKTKKNRKIDSNKRMLGDDKNEKINGKDHLFILILSPIHSSSDFLCVGHDGFFAHPEYCTRYYRCSHGMAEMFECSPGTAWDDMSKTCAWVDQVNCDQKILGYSTSTPGEETTTLNKKAGVDIAPSDPNSLSSASGTNGKDGRENTPIVECQPTGIYALPDPNDCSSYYQCDKGVQTKLNCTDKRLFDVSKRECNDFERVFCGARPINPVGRNQCVNKHNGIYPDTERECHFYYKCLGKKKVYELKCSGDQKFNSYTGQCGPMSSVPAPCGTFIPGNAGIKDCGNFRLYIQAILLMIIFLKF